MSVQLILTTCDSNEAGERLARSLVERRLAACVNLVPGLRSIYRWKGAVEQADEVLLLIKTTADRRAELQDVLLAEHGYELPELLVVDVADGLPAYLDWVVGETRPR